jgi:carboxymethylenebutenolidase
LEIVNQDVTFACSDGSEMAAHLSRPGGTARAEEGKRPAIMVIHEAYGLNEQIKGIAHRFAVEGFVAIAPNLFTRNGDVMTEKNIESAMRPLWSLPPEKRNDQSAIQSLMKTMSDTDRKVMSIFFLGREKMEKQMVSDLLSCKDYLKSLSFVRGDRLGITGFCLGGDSPIKSQQCTRSALQCHSTETTHRPWGQLRKLAALS